MLVLLMISEYWLDHKQILECVCERERETHQFIPNITLPGGIRKKSLAETTNSWSLILTSTFPLITLNI